jgi:hypothetical protein
MEVTLPNHSKYIWIFDAKYRIELNNNRGDLPTDEVDFVPDDALNQMHRYRDALINFSQHESNALSARLSRPVYGAFALYPGFFEQHSTENPYKDTIEKVGIGAFALLPSSEFSGGNQWLKDYLVSHIGLHTNSSSIHNINESLSLLSPSRIPLSGMFQNFYRNLILVSVNNSLDSQNYHQLFKSDNENSGVYQISKRLFKNATDENIIRELKFIAITGSSINGQSANFFNAIWPIKSVELKVPYRVATNPSANDEVSEPYWQIVLGPKLALKNTIKNVPLSIASSEIKLTTLELLEGINDYAHIPEVYISRVSPPSAVCL